MKNVDLAQKIEELEETLNRENSLLYTFIFVLFFLIVTIFGKSGEITGAPLIMLKILFGSLTFVSLILTNTVWKRTRKQRRKR